MTPKLVIIDTDSGIDDAQAIMMALAAPGLQILGITCCFGNTGVENVCQNVLQVLSVCQRTEVPVFRGAAVPLVRPPEVSFDPFGTDGLGDVLEDRDPLWKEKIQRENAVSAMVRLVADNPKQVSLVALGPLTNLALAIRLEPSFALNLKELFIMGGNMEGKGNVTVCGEFNFVLDPESAYVVLEEYLCPTQIASYEYCRRNKLTWDFFDKLMNLGTPAAIFMKTITSKSWAYSKDAVGYFGSGFVSYDSYAMAACIDCSVVTERIECPVRVELQGTLCRGMMALDVNNILKKNHRVSVMKTCDQTKLRKLLLASVSIGSREPRLL
ncbi:inosine-uridine preferring nucleoside hydrolase [Esox lucius]|uniref:Inosine/uridine-preferring nucleoside hydrolase domain-containing protein n=1 Tax=Esox lucius TaxID=8010 RepID=A0A3P8XW94_ESOLU|nr:inosine-uridine preferring nucleoside hydrolase [Esox lucius]XP_010869585.1 inosine-uridine preferring nucleoside hydrolase [Esox lucius]XP_010869586.1 inosine-uridine preferring nucleoside hydrolase [Esox lucius]